METLPWHPIQYVNWKEFPYKPEVDFQIAHDNKHIFIHYRVEEEYVKAQYVRINEAVWEDSCVEFFISFDGGVHYYNIEFNVLGTGLTGYGSAVREERERLGAETIATIQTASMVVNAGGKKIWNMILVIPSPIFANEQNQGLSGITASANFYKCGDGLPTPHFLSWAKIDYPKPNFHLPEFFGEITFE